MTKHPGFRLVSGSHQSETEVIPVFQDGEKKAIPPQGIYGRLVEKLREAEVFSAGADSACFTRFGGQNGADHVLFVGLGRADELTLEKARRAGGVAWQKLIAEKCRGAQVRISGFFTAAGRPADLTGERVVGALAEGIGLGSYRGRTLKGAKKPEDARGPESIGFFRDYRPEDKGLGRDLATALESASRAAEAAGITRDWSNEPSNIGTPEYFAREAQKLARTHGLKCRVLGERDCAREKMGLFLGVGQGSERESKFIVLEHAGRGAKRKTVALVGKGVTFDSGGISIKPATRMEDMKHDMTGAATVMGAMALVAREKIANRVLGILAFTENMPSGNAIQPGNILVSRSGKSVEVINTDAEGRLILADALDYAQDLKPDAVIDVATLTGAVSIALGKHCGAVLGNDDALTQSILRAAGAAGERLWQLPLFDEYFDDMKSEMADMKNVGADGAGGCIRGAIFLKQFIRKGVKWAHLDIAATAYNLTHLPYCPKKGASGLYVRTLARLAGEF